MEECEECQWSKVKRTKKWQQDQEMTTGLSLLSHQEVKMVILEWWTWWRWLVHSSTVWKASHESLKALTPVPNLIRKSPQMQVMCGWKKILMHKHYNMSMHKHYNMSMHQYFLCFVTLFDCLIIDCMGWNLFVCLFLHTFIHIFFNVTFDQSFPFYVSKIQKPHKK